MTQEKRWLEFVSNSPLSGSAKLLKTVKDPKIGIGHIGHFTILHNCWVSLGIDSHLIVFSNDIMPLTKISSSAIYHRLIRQLSEYGYIRYLPSYYKGKEVRFTLLNGNYIAPFRTYHLEALLF